MQVTHIIRPAAGGMRRHLALLCSELPRYGWQPSIVAPPDFVPEPEGGEVPIARAPIAARPHPVRDLRAVAATARAARGADLLHGHGLRGAWIGALAARRLDIPFVFTAHNLAPAAGLLPRLLLRWVGRQAAATIVISHAVEESLRAQGISCRRWALIPNGIPLAPYIEPRDTAAVRCLLEVEPGAPLVVAVGRLSPEKGFDLLLRAAPALAARVPEVRIVVAGDGREAEALRALARELGVEAAVRLPGRVADIPALLQAADLVAVPSRSEGQGLVAIEAMASARPVVATRVGGLVETVPDGAAGRLVPPEDPAALAAALADLLLDPVARARMSAAARTHATAEYPLDRMVKRIVDVYREERG